MLKDCFLFWCAELADFLSAPLATQTKILYKTDWVMDLLHPWKLLPKNQMYSLDVVTKMSN